MVHENSFPLNEHLTFWLKDASSLARVLAYDLAKERLTSTNSSSIEATIYGEDSSSYYQAYVSDAL
jgi:hypothetical protein